ncbi:hypothetical protein FJT64_004604 [Amphibalanus amphitrite]|uniref:Uncharacterized protein n=1 Tax=Amphibalanus amphitrite TaxID=1232801 RepID=A0A6A4VYR0_AMPAM|nr:uncharacterized protein LOC122380609 isoform X1 [Amphibalanus amphitrite]KAF0298019.1 hypothetical protein FJT64_004604 [Amphibalanus amphitrite]
MYKSAGAAALSQSSIRPTMSPRQCPLPLPMVPVVLLLVTVAVRCPTALAMPTNEVLDDRVLFSKLQTCYIASGMDDLDPSVTPDTMPSVEQRSDILQSFLDCCSKQDFPAIEALEARKQKSNGEEVSSLLKELQSTIQAVYKKYLMGSSVGLTVPGS